MIYGLENTKNTSYTEVTQASKNKIFISEISRKRPLKWYYDQIFTPCFFECIT